MFSALALDWPVKPDKAEATYEHGLLRIEVPSKIRWKMRCRSPSKQLARKPRPRQSKLKIHRCRVPRKRQRIPIRKVFDILAWAGHTPPERRIRHSILLWNFRL